MLSYLRGNARPEISMVVHQIAHFCINPQLTHKQAIKRRGRYFLHTRKEGIFSSTEKSKGMECYVDSDFGGGWQQADSDNADNIMSRTGFVIMYTYCPVF